MRIAIIGPAYPLRGGIANFNEQLSTALTKQNHEVIIYSFSLQYPSFLFPGKSQFETGEAPKGLSIQTIINSINPLNWLISAKKIIKSKPDLVIVRFWLPFMGPTTGTICRLIKRALNVPIIAITDNVLPHEKRIADKMLTQYFVSSCDAFITMSKSVLEDLNQFTESIHKKYLPHPIYNQFGEFVSRKEGIDNLQLNPEFSYILFFGFVRKYKGLELLLNSLAHCDLKKLKVKLLIAGEFYEDQNYYLNLIDSLKLTDNVIIRSNYIPSEDVKFYFCASSIVAQTYLNATQSGVTQIAYHFEVPMLVTNVGGLSEIVLHHKVGYVCEKNPNEITDAINDFFENNRFDEFKKNTVIEKLRFSWDSFVAGVIELYHNVKTK